MRFILALMVALTSLASYADIYMSRGEDGEVYFTDTPTTEDFKMIVREDPPVLPWRDYSRIVAERNQLDPKLVRAVIHVESGEKIHAVSSAGAQGLMQLMPETAKELGVDDPMEPRANIRGGVAYLAELIHQFDGNLELALAAYNAGPGAVKKYGGIPPYPETVNFVEKVLEVYAIQQK